MSRTPGSPKTGGRKRGSLDKARRLVIQEEQALDILRVYDALGGVDFLLKWARDNPSEFVRQGLSRLWIPMPKEADIDIGQLNAQFNIANMSEQEALHRLMYGLTLRAGQARDITPQESCRVPDVPAEAFARPAPRWIDPATLPPTEPSLTQEEVAKLAKEKAAQDLIGLNYNGSAREHGLAKPAPVVEKSGRVPVRLRGKGRELI